MIVTMVHAKVKSEYISAFKNACIKNHLESVKENGNVRFDILQNETDPNLFVLYEAYVSEEAAAKHKETPHYIEWRDTVADWMEIPRKGIKHQLIAPII